MGEPYIHSAIEVSVEPATEPVPYADLALHLRQSETAEQTMITNMAKAARRMLEEWLGRAFITQTLVAYWDRPPCGGRDFLCLPRAPVTVVSAVKYIDTSGVLQTWDVAQYDVDLKSVPMRIRPVFGAIWPYTLDVANALQVTFVAGEADATAVQDEIKLAISMLTAHLFEHRQGEADIPDAITNLVANYRVVWV